MTEIFGTAYADAYNDVYTDKNYAAECDLIEQLFLRYGTTPILSVVDFGCGTGNHAFPLAARGYEVVGVERSKGMLTQALQKRAEAGSPERLRFEEGDIRSVQLGRRFDAALMMFAVLGYQIENHDVTATLRTVRQHLEVGGLFLCDMWYGPTVLRERPSERIKVISADRGRILRAASGELDSARQSCMVRYHMWQLRDDRLVAETTESHLMRFFFPQELRLLLEYCGFSLVRLGAFPEFDTDPDESTWNVMAVARAV